LKKDKENIGEEELLRRFYTDGNPEWLGFVLERYTALLLGVCMKYLREEAAAKDAVQQVFLKALTAIPQKNILNLGAWLYQVARNECLSQLRSAKNILGEEHISNAPQPETPPLSGLLLEEKKAAELSKALDRLKKEQRICIILFFFEQKSYQQIAEQTGYSLKQVKSNIQNGKRNLKIELAAFAPGHLKKERHD
jgi:RNA polymerase sigma-70 factor (ECF subfamily)